MPAPNYQVDRNFEKEAAALDATQAFSLSHAAPVAGVLAMLTVIGAGIIMSRRK